MTYEPSSAADALAAMQASRAQLAQRVNCPPQYHVLFGALMGGITAAQAAPPAGTFAIEGLCALVGIWMYRNGRRRMGFFVNGYRRGRTRPVVAVLLVCFLGLMGGGVWLKDEQHLTWAPIAAGVIMFAIGTWASFVWQAVYRAELRASEAGPAA